MFINTIKCAPFPLKITLRKWFNFNIKWVFITTCYIRPRVLLNDNSSLINKLIKLIPEYQSFFDKKPLIYPYGHDMPMYSHVMMSSCPYRHVTVFCQIQFYSLDWALVTHFFIDDLEIHIEYKIITTIIMQWRVMFFKL